MSFPVCPIKKGFLNIYDTQFNNIIYAYLIKKLRSERCDLTFINGQKHGFAKSPNEDTGYFFCGRKHGLFLPNPSRCCRYTYYHNDDEFAGLTYHGILEPRKLHIVVKRQRRE